MQDWLVSFLREFRNQREYNTFSSRGVFRAHPNDPGRDPGNLVYGESLRVVAPGWLSTGVTNYETLGDMVEALVKRRCKMARKEAPKGLGFRGLGGLGGLGFRGLGLRGLGLRGLGV